MNCGAVRIHHTANVTHALEIDTSVQYTMQADGCGSISISCISIQLHALESLPYSPVAPAGLEPRLCLKISEIPPPSARSRSSAAMAFGGPGRVVGGGAAQGVEVADSFEIAEPTALWPSGTNRPQTKTDGWACRACLMTAGCLGWFFGVRDLRHLPGWPESRRRLASHHTHQSTRQPPQRLQGPESMFWLSAVPAN